MELTKEEHYTIEGIVHEYSSMYGGKIALDTCLTAIVENADEQSRKVIIEAIQNTSKYHIGEL